MGGQSVSRMNDERRRGVERERTPPANGCVAGGERGCWAGQPPTLRCPSIRTKRVDRTDDPAHHSIEGGGGVGTRERTASPNKQARPPTPHTTQSRFAPSPRSRGCAENDPKGDPSHTTHDRSIPVSPGKCAAARAVCFGVKRAARASVWRGLDRVNFELWGEWMDWAGWQLALSSAALSFSPPRLPVLQAVAPPRRGATTPHKRKGLD